MKTLSLCLVALAASASSFAQTTVPATPSLTAGAEIKGLRFDWEPVAEASWYELEYQAHQGAPFLQHGDDLPATVTTARHRFPLHLYDWTYARYRVAACKTLGCARSPEISVSLLRRDAVGYFKPAETLVGLYNMVKPNYHPDSAPYLTFGTDVAYSASGTALIVGESGESRDADGISGGWDNLRAARSGAVWLY